MAAAITVQNKAKRSSLIGMHGGDGGHVIFEAKHFTPLLVFVPEIIISHRICNVFAENLAEIVLFFVSLLCCASCSN